MAEVDTLGARCLLPTDSGFPPSLLEIPDAPVVLFTSAHPGSLSGSPHPLTPSPLQESWNTPDRLPVPADTSPPGPLSLTVEGETSKWGE
ncbi:MAG: hypothetical protein ACRDYC_03715, partial [Acidimicrobiales bacterium]